jgi:lactate dehydrogenase-like 2-hydroxyacid dehydrogenase
VKRPRVLLTRRWPEAVETRLAERYDVTLSEGDQPLGSDALGAAMQNYDALCPTVTDTVSAAVIKTDVTPVSHPAGARVLG